MLGGLTLFDKVEVVRCHAPVAAGATDITDSTEISTVNRDLFCFIAGFGAIVTGAVTSIEIHGSIDGTTFALMKDDAGVDCKLVVADDADSTYKLIEIVKPHGSVIEIKPVVKRATQNATLEHLTCLVGNSRKMPTTQPSGTAAVTRFISPKVP